MKKWFQGHGFSLTVMLGVAVFVSIPVGAWIMQDNFVLGVVILSGFVFAMLVSMFVTFVAGKGGRFGQT